MSPWKDLQGLPFKRNRPEKSKASKSFLGWRPVTRNRWRCSGRRLSPSLGHHPGRQHTKIKPEMVQGGIAWRLAMAFPGLCPVPEGRRAEVFPIRTEPEQPALLAVVHLPRLGGTKGQGGKMFFDRHGEIKAIYLGVGGSGDMTAILVARLAAPPIGHLRPKLTKNVLDGGRDAPIRRARRRSRGGFSPLSLQLSEPGARLTKVGRGQRLPSLLAPFIEDGVVVAIGVVVEISSMEFHK
jgi:hypothetical protein